MKNIKNVPTMFPGADPELDGEVTHSLWPWTPWDPPGGAGECHWRCLGFSSEPAASTAWSQISSRWKCPNNPIYFL